MFVCFFCKPVHSVVKRYAHMLLREGGHANSDIYLHLFQFQCLVTVFLKKLASSTQFNN